MAQTVRNKKAPANKQAASKAKKQAQNQRQEPQEEFIRGEILLLVSFALAALLFLSNFRLCGPAGDYLRKVQLGIFGSIGFAAPVLLFVGTCFAMSNQGNPIASIKIGAAVTGTVALCGLAEMLFGEGVREGQKLFDAFIRSSEKGTGGGLVGGLLARGLGSILGVAGTYLVLVALFLICCVCVTERSLIAAVKKGGKTACRYAREDADRRRVIREERKEEKKRLREEQRVRGVNLSSTRLGYAEPEEEYEEFRPEYGYDEEEGDGVREVLEPDFEDMPSGGGREDVFTGKISLLPAYEEEEPYIDEEDDSVPFDEEDVIAVEEALREVWSQEADEAVEEEWKGGSLFDRDLSALEEEAEDAAWEAEEASVQGQCAGGAADPDPGGWNSCEEELPSTEIVDDMEEPGEHRQVTTAYGKRIESDSEILKAKLEARRKEAQREKYAGFAGEERRGSEGGRRPAQPWEKNPAKEYRFPPVTLLKRGERLLGASPEQEYRNTAIKLQQTLKNFGVGVTVTNISCGPAVTRYELHPEQGVKVSKIVGLADDIKLNLAAADIRIEAPIPGKSAVGIEVPNKENVTVYLREIFESEEFKKAPSKLSFAVGKDIGGQVVVTDIAKMPHLLIAGATGAGKSVCINTLIMSILYKASPDEVKLIMVDPKVVELSAYNGIPHLLIPVVTDPKKASGALNWAVAEMMNRYDQFARYNVRNLSGYNAKLESLPEREGEETPQKMPQIIIIIDELADLMMVSPGEVEEAICRLAQLARAAGIHLVIATQRPSVNVITGLIKANVPSRIAFAVSSGVDSRTIIDMYGAEKLLGKGDMLFYPSGVPKPQRVQGAFVSDQEVAEVVEFLVSQELRAAPQPDIESRISLLADAAAPEAREGGRDDYFEQAGKFIIEKEKASIGMLQRMYKIGFNRAARIMDQLAEAGVVGEEEGTKPRKILMNMAEFEDLLRREP